jgi:TolA-binding protein
LREPELAATAFMRVPIQYPHERQLAAEALAAAGGQFERLGQSEQALSVHRELLRRFPESAAAAELKGKVEEK